VLKVRLSLGKNPTSLQIVLPRGLLLWPFDWAHAEAKSSKSPGVLYSLSHWL